MIISIYISFVIYIIYCQINDKIIYKYILVVKVQDYELFYFWFNFIYIVIPESKNFRKKNYYISAIKIIVK